MSCPLWIVDRARAPGWSVGGLVLLNTFIVIVFQVRIGRNVTTLRQGGAALRRAGLLFALACRAIGFTAGLPGWAALPLLGAAVAVLSAGELNHAAGTFTLDFGLAPAHAHAQGEYQGLAGLGLGAGDAAAPTGDDRPLPDVRHWRLDRPRRSLRPPRPNRLCHRPLGRAYPAGFPHRQHRPHRSLPPRQPGSPVNPASLIAHADPSSHQSNRPPAP